MEKIQAGGVGSSSWNNLFWTQNALKSDDYLIETSSDVTDLFFAHIDKNIREGLGESF